MCIRDRYQAFAKEVSDRVGARLVVFDHLYRASSLELLGDAKSDVSAPRDDDPLDRRCHAPQFDHYAPDVLVGRQHEDFVAILDDRFTRRWNGMVSAVDLSLIHI